MNDMTRQLINVTPPGDPKDIRTIGESQGYRGLQVHFGAVFDHAYERQTPALTTAYVIPPELLTDVIAGAPLIIQLINVVQHPPIAVMVGHPETKERAKQSMVDKSSSND